MLAIMIFVLAAGAAAWSLVRALRQPPESAPARRTATVTELAGTPARAEVSPTLLLDAVEHDPFNRERQRPAVRFRMAGEGNPDSLEAAAVAVASAEPTLRLVGTAVLSGGKAFAICQWGDEPAKVVRIGERIGNMTLRTVQPGRAVFASNKGKSIELRVRTEGD
jgi:hypothetical protein